MCPASPALNDEPDSSSGRKKPDGESLPAPLDSLESLSRSFGSLTGFLEDLSRNLGMLAQAIENQAAAIAALVEEVAVQADDEPEDDGIPQAMSTKR